MQHAKRKSVCWLKWRNTIYITAYTIFTVYINEVFKGLYSALIQVFMSKVCLWLNRTYMDIYSSSSDDTVLYLFYLNWSHCGYTAVTCLTWNIICKIRLLQVINVPRFTIESHYLLRNILFYTYLGSNVSSLLTWLCACKNDCLRSLTMLQ